MGNHKKIPLYSSTIEIHCQQEITIFFFWKKKKYNHPTLSSKTCKTPPPNQSRNHHPNHLSAQRSQNNQKATLRFLHISCFVQLHLDRGLQGIWIISLPGNPKNESKKLAISAVNQNLHPDYQRQWYKDIEELSSHFLLRTMQDIYTT